LAVNFDIGDDPMKIRLERLIVRVWAIWIYHDQSIIPRFHMESGDVECGRTACLFRQQVLAGLDGDLTSLGSGSEV